MDYRERDPMHEVCLPHRIPRASGNSKGEIRGGRRHKNHSNRVARNLEERNVCTKGKNHKQDVTIELPLP